MMPTLPLQLRWSLISILAAAPFSAAQAQPSAQALLYQRATAATCAACHGTDGHTTEGSTIPALAGKPGDEMISQMNAFKEGSRPATVMQQIAKGLTDIQITSIAHYYADIKRP